MTWIGSAAVAQDLEPRAYVASPTGVTFLAIAGGRSSGGVLVDPSLPVEDVEATVDVASLGVGRTFSLAGRTALVVAAFPYAWVGATGRVQEESTSISRSGLADPRFRLSVNLLGGEALTAREFARARRPTIVGVSLTAAPPVGKYDRTKLVNISAHRWSFKPEVGVSHQIRRWTVDGYVGVWLFTANDDFFPGGSLRTQQPVTAVQAHVSYTVRRGMWVAGDGTWYSGGRTTVNGVSKGDLQRNSRIGGTVSVPIARGQSIKVAASTGATTRIGADFQTIAVAWQMSWIR